MRALCLGSWLLAVGVTVSACAGPQDAVPQWTVDAGPAMPAAITNNAVAAATVDSKTWIFSFLGLGAGKDYRAITRSAYALDVAEGRWESLLDVPGDEGRIAPTAQALGGLVYVFGGYSVAADGLDAAGVSEHRRSANRRGAGPTVSLGVEDLNVVHVVVG